MYDRFQLLQDQLENNDKSIETQGSTSRKCCKKHVKKSSAEERLNTSGSQESLQQVPTDRQATDGHEREPSQSNRRKLERWLEHFRELLNRPTPETSPDTQPSDTDLPIDCNF